MTDNPNILVVDDEADSRSLLTGILVSEGYHVRAADSGRLALASVDAWLPELILLDIRMQGMDGFEVCRRLKAGNKSQCVPVIFITAAGEVDERVKGLAVGAVDYISKPFHREELVARVRTHLELARLRAELEKQVSQVTESEARYRTVFDLVPVAIYSCDASGVIQAFNGRAAELWGRQPASGDTDERFCGSFKLFRPDGSFIAREQCPMAEVVSGKISEVCDAEIHIERPDGSRVAVVVNIRPVRNELGVVTGAINCFYDITERKRAEEALREGADRLRFMAESMPQKICTAKPNGDFDYFNQQWVEFSGMALDQIRNWGWTQIVHPNDIGDSIRLWKHAIETEEPFQVVNRLKRADGSYRWHLSRARAMRDASGKVSMWIGSNTDIHDQIEAEEKLRQTQKLESIGLLASGIAHDFNNILTGILGNASLLAPRAPASDRPLLDDILKASERAADLVNQLLAYAGKRRSTIARCNLSNLISETLHLIETSIPKMVQLQLSLQPDLPLIEADVSQIQQIVMNLVINAAEAIGAGGGEVWISTGTADGDAANGSKPGRSVYMKVRDSGSGMDEAMLTKIFDPFFTTKFLGRGLGLAAVSGIMRSHKGRIVVESIPGKGSSFTIFLPAVMAYSFKTRLGTPRSDRQIATGTDLILVVDDDAIVRRMAKAALEVGGYAVLLAENGLEAVNIFHQRPDITGVFLDIAMAVMGGEEALRRLREIRADVPVLIASGYSEMIARERFGDNVQASFIQKPFTVNQLVEAIIAVVSQPETSTFCAEWPATSE